MGELNENEASCSSNKQFINSAINNNKVCPLKPDRQGFQRSLSYYNEELNAIATRIGEILDKTDDGELIVLNRKKTPLREKRRELKNEENEIRPKVVDFRKQLDALDRSISEVENFLVYKAENQLITRLKQLEEWYNRKQFTSVRIEQALIKEIDKLKRNQVKLTKYNNLLEEKKILVARFREAKERLNVISRAVRQMRCEWQNICGQVDYLRRELSELRSKYRDYSVKKKYLIEQYDNQRQTYTNWLKENRADEINDRNYRHAATFPAALRRYTDNYTMNDDDDEELLEPFFEQKMACTRVITYLQYLLSRMDSSDRLTDRSKELSTENVENFHKSGGETDDSAEDMPLNLARLKKYPSLPIKMANDSGPNTSAADNSGVTRAKKNKKSAKKPCQPINHQFEVIHLFNELDLIPPKCYQEVGRALEQAHELLEFYKQQTNIIVWDDSDYCCHITESECTADSVWNDSTDISERGSVKNFVSGGYYNDCLARHHSISPLALHPSSSNSSHLDEKVASINLNDDEGLAQHHSISSLASHPSSSSSSHLDKKVASINLNDDEGIGKESC